MNESIEKTLKDVIEKLSGEGVVTEEKIQKAVDEKLSALLSNVPQQERFEDVDVDKSFADDYNHVFKKFKHPGDAIVNITKADHINDERVYKLQNLADKAMIGEEIRRCFGKNPPENLALKVYLRELQKAGLDTSTSGEGNEWVPTLASPEFVKHLTGMTRVAQLFPEARMYSATTTVRGNGNSLKARSPSEGSAPGVESTLSSQGYSLTARLLRSYVDITQELVEDAVGLDIIGETQDELSAMIARAWDSAILNGDGTSSDDGVFAAETDPPEECGIIGLRHEALTLNNTGSMAHSGAFATTSLMSGAQLMAGAAIQDIGNCVFFMHPSAYARQIANITSAVTANTYGGTDAAIRKLKVPELFGMRVVLTDQMVPFVRADGYYQVSGLTPKSADCFVVAHLPSYRRGVWRAPQLEQDKAIKTGLITVAASARVAFVKVQPAATSTAGYVYGFPW